MEEVKKQSLENENIDNVLNSVSDEYLNKTRRIKKITYSTILSVLLVIAIFIIVLSTIVVDLKPSFIGNPASYSIFISGSEKMYIDESSEEYEEFYKIYSESFKISYLSALFTGKLGSYEIEETLDKFYLNESSKSGMTNVLSTAVGSNYVKLEFNSEQKIKKANGEDYGSVYDSKSLLTFEDVYFTINATNEDTDLTFYFGTTGIGLGYTITKITIRANTYTLYEFATESSK